MIQQNAQKQKQIQCGCGQSFPNLQLFITHSLSFLNQNQFSYNFSHYITKVYTKCRPFNKNQLAKSLDGNENVSFCEGSQRQYNEDVPDKGQSTKIDQSQYWLKYSIFQDQQSLIEQKQRSNQKQFKNNHNSNQQNKIDLLKPSIVSSNKKKCLLNLTNDNILSSKKQSQNNSTQIVIFKQKQFLTLKDIYKNTSLTMKIIKAFLKMPNIDIRGSVIREDNKINGLLQLILQKYKKRKVKYLIQCLLCQSTKKFTQFKYLNHIKQRHSLLSFKQIGCIAIQTTFKDIFIVPIQELGTNQFWKCSCQMQVEMTRKQFVNHVLDVHYGYCEHLQL